ncbi:hypothetical protein [Methylobacterium sp. E-046]|uniref:hypothetical protein n=1 Tax=Methylobacterium sp. E-046 TaxID=2836576 RepID=UPI001FBA20D4|nr:hypothetical protein [Methylobacterium sp. E-046]MCJ2102711.1 hypothetical protein [Methylobacterium sp. E-046]
MSEWESIVVEGDRWVSPTEIGDWLAMTAERVRQLAVDGVFRRQEGTYPHRECVLRYLAWRAADRRDATQTAGDSRIRDLRADEIALRLERESGALIAEARAEALAIVDEFAGPLRSDMMSIPPRVTKDLALRQAMEREIEAAFGAASKRADAAGSPDLGRSTPPNRAARRAARHAGPR